MPRPFIAVFASFAIALSALALAGATAAAECDATGSCDTRLALSIVALAPACLVGLVVLISLWSSAGTSALRRFTLAVALAVAFVPLAAFVIRDIWTLLLMGILLAALIVLVLHDAREAAEARAGREQERIAVERGAVGMPEEAGAATPARVDERRLDRIVAAARGLDEATLSLSLGLGKAREARERLHEAMDRVTGEGEAGGVIDFGEARGRRTRE